MADETTDVGERARPGDPELHRHLQVAARREAQGLDPRRRPELDAVAPDGKTYVLELNEAGDKISVSRNTINAVSAAASLAAGIGRHGRDRGQRRRRGGAERDPDQDQRLRLRQRSRQRRRRDAQRREHLQDRVRRRWRPRWPSAAAAPAGIGASIGVSVARNFIGWTPGGDEMPAEVQAYLKNTSVDADGDLA